MERLSRHHFSYREVVLCAFEEKDGREEEWVEGMDIERNWLSQLETFRFR
jgi:hypothetical protein